MTSLREIGTTVWIDKPTSEQIGELAKMFRRSKAGQIRWMLDQELIRLEQSGTSQPDNGKVLSSDCAE